MSSSSRMHRWSFLYLCLCAFVVDVECHDEPWVDATLHRCSHRRGDRLVCIWCPSDLGMLEAVARTSLEEAYAPVGLVRMFIRDYGLRRAILFQIYGGEFDSDASIHRDMVLLPRLRHDCQFLTSKNMNLLSTRDSGHRSGHLSHITKYT
jgi:hypothetical protein